MARLLIVTNFFILFLLCIPVFGQVADSTIDNLRKIPTKYITGIDKKIAQYSSRISSKTEKTLTKLARWENKIQALLQKASPETAKRLFGNNQLTFTSLLQKITDGEALALQYQAPYNKYRDDVTTNLRYLAQQKDQLDSSVINKIKATSRSMSKLAKEENQNEAIQQFIKDRKKQLAEQAIQYIGKSKYLAKINKEAYYYSETIRNYKEIFNNCKKTEETVKIILSKIPAFSEFFKQNSALAGLFDVSAQNTVMVPGMQTRSSVQQLIQGRISALGGNAQVMGANLQSAQAQLSDIKTRLNSGSRNGEMPDFKPNGQKAKTFGQRIEYSTNIRFVKSNGLVTSGTDIGLGIGYKLNDKSVIGLGASYKLGIGDIQHIHFSTQGIGTRSYLDWKLKNQFFISGGFEMNYLTWKPVGLQVSPDQRNDPDGIWQKSALIGIMKKLNLKTKLVKATNVQLLYDFLSQEQIPVSQPILFRMGYNF